MLRTLGANAALMSLAMLAWTLGARSALYATTALTAASYGGFWMLVPALAGELFGGAHYGVGSHLSPDDYIAENEADGVVRHNQDMRLVTGSDAGNSEYANDGGGGFYGADRHLAEYHNYATDDEPPPSQVAGRNSAAIASMQGIKKQQGFTSGALTAW